jgi:hypothetical protein
LILQLVKPHAVFDGICRCCDLSACCATKMKYTKSPDNELCTILDLKGNPCCFKGAAHMICVHPTTCLKLKAQCLCCYVFSALPCDEEVPCGCAVCGAKCAGKFVDPEAFKQGKGPATQTMERTLAPVGAVAGTPGANSAV